MVYELWRTDSPFTMSAAFPTQQEAIAALRQTLAAQGPHFLMRFVLVRKDRRNRRATVAEGDRLLALVASRVSPEITTPADGQAPLDVAGPRLSHHVIAERR